MASRVLPLFPLPVVLLPGALVPLHIFEPRYRRMLADCLAGDRRFGLIWKPEGVDERALPAGHVGCVAVIEDHAPHPDGRADIVVRGDARFALDGFATMPLPYHVGETSPVEDEHESPIVLGLVADEVRALLARVVRAVRALEGAVAPAPALPEEPARLGFAVAALLDMDLAARHRLLASRSPLWRLGELQALLARAVEPLELRAAVHRHRAESGGGDPSLELGA